MSRRTLFSPGTLLDEHTSAQERKLYEAILALEAGAGLAEFMADTTHDQREQLLKEAQQLREHAAAIRQMIEERVVPSITPTQVEEQ